MVHSNFSVGQSSKEEGLWVFEAEDWTAVKIHQGQQALDSCVHTAVHMDAGKDKINTEHKMQYKLTNTTDWLDQIRTESVCVCRKTEKTLTCRPAAQHRWCFLSWPQSASSQPPFPLCWDMAPSRTPDRGWGSSGGRSWPGEEWLGSGRRSPLGHGQSCLLHQQPEQHSKEKGKMCEHYNEAL